MFDVVEDIVSEYKEDKNLDGLQLEIIRIFSVDPEVDEKEFSASTIHQLTDQIFDTISAFYQRKSASIAQHVLPVLKMY
jgi:preprotein translocase subunit SecA